MLGIITQQFNDAAFVSPLCGAGLIDVIVSLLQTASDFPQRALPVTPDFYTSSSSSSSSPPPTNTQDTPHTPFAFKCGVLRVLANICFQNVAVQNIAGEKGAVVAVMNQCRIDDHNPLLREWAVWALRNLTLGNERNSRLVSELRVNAVANQEELKTMNVNATLGSDGKVKIRNVN